MCGSMLSCWICDGYVEEGRELRELDVSDLYRRREIWFFLGKSILVAVMKAPRASVLVWLLQISSRVPIPGGVGSVG